jgi:hypothetical protein
MTESCHCGKPLHYTDPKVEYLIRAMVKELGATVPVVVEDRTWLVPRHWIALHGLKAEEIATLGFEEI